jgi:hypothetical protein
MDLTKMGEFPTPEPPEPPIDPPIDPPVVEEGYLSIDTMVPSGPDTFSVLIRGGTTVPVDGYSMFVGYPDGLQALGFTPGAFVTDYVGDGRPYQVFVQHPTGSPGAVPSQHLVLKCGFWTLGNSTPSDGAPVTWTVPGRYMLENVTKKFGRNMKLPAMFTRLTGRYIEPLLTSLVVEVPRA